MNSFVTKALLISMCCIGILIFSACEEQATESPLKALETNYSELTSGKGTREQIDSARKELIQAYVQFVNSQPEDSLATRYLDAAATLHASQPAESREAIKIFDRLINEYPDATRTSEALFMKAYILNNSLQDYDGAKQYYEEFIRKYPDHELAASASAELKNMGISNEEIVDSWGDSTTVGE